MARKKRVRNEFQPDRTQTSLLSKLYLTRKQRLSLLKWTLYGIVLAALSVLQDTILAQFRPLGAAADVVPCGILLICLLQDTEVGCVFSLVASMCYLFSGSSPGAYVIIALTFLGLGASIFRQSYLRKGFSAAMLCAAAALLVYELTVFSVCWAMGLTFFGRIGRFIITWLMTLVAMPCLYPLLNLINKIGGESWKE